MFISGHEFSDEVIDRIRGAVATEPLLSRAVLSKKVCEWIGWTDVFGNVRDMSCRVALLKLAKRGVIELPEVTSSSLFLRDKKSVDRASVHVDVPSKLEIDLSDLGEIDLVSVNRSQVRWSHLWNFFFDKHHYLGAGPLCGAQMRYLIRSSVHGFLGGLSFSASAWQLKARDRWIGWSEDSRKKHLAKVVCNSRFLILPHVQVKNLASHVLSLASRQVVQDWQNRYGYVPVLLETFVEREKFLGTSYRAANWQHVGVTKGRGRQDRLNEYSLSVKDIYVLPLVAGARDILCGGPAPPILQLRDGSRDWAEEEFGEVNLGDERLSQRLVEVARDLYSRPQANIPQACQTRSRAKAAYRFFAHPETTMEQLLTTHFAATTTRIRHEKVVLVTQDTTTLNYTAHPMTEGLGHIGSSMEHGIGLMVHDTLAFNTEGTPLGLVDVQCWARNLEDFGKKERRHKSSIEDKESFKWIKSYQRASEVQRQCPQSLVVSLGDRESDIYELFAHADHEISGAKLLVRAEHDRCVAEGQGRLWETMNQMPIAGIQEILVPRRKKCPARVARLEVRFAKVRLFPPAQKPHLGELTMWAVYALEKDVDEGISPLSWMLLTTVETASFAEACERLRWYTLRWGIEVYHRTLKSGCQVEKRQFGNADCIEACLAIDMVVAWRIFHLTKLGRETPDVPCTVFFEEAEWRALTTYINRSVEPPKQTPTLREATRMMASLGGFLGRKCDREPGTQSLWMGMQRLDDLAKMWTVFSQINFHPPPSSVSRRSYG